MTSAVLLDSHILLGALFGRAPYGKSTVRLLQSDRSLYFSSLSIAELTLKASLKKAPFLPPDLATQLIGLGFIELTFDARAAAEINRFPALHHHDPFDRMLLAQAEVNDLVFVTSDKTLIDLNLPFVHPSHL